MRRIASLRRYKPDQVPRVHLSVRRDAPRANYAATLAAGGRERQPESCGARAPFRW